VVSIRRLWTKAGKTRNSRGMWLIRLRRRREAGGDARPTQRQKECENYDSCATRVCWVALGDDARAACCAG